MEILLPQAIIEGDPHRLQRDRAGSFGCGDLANIFSSSRTAERPPIRTTPEITGGNGGTSHH